MDPPLHDVRVLDLSRVLAGPFCSMILGDLGADIVKVEAPGGDLTRAWGPPFHEGVSGYYLSVNRNKRSIGLDLRTEGGQEILHELMESSDVILENYRPGVAARLGADYETARRLREDVVYCSITGYGQDGPYRDRASFDIILQALGGFMSITGEEGRPPVRIGVAIADLGAGLHAAIAILAALWRRAKTGRGDRIDVSILDGQVFWLTYMAQQYLLTGTPPGRMGSRHPHIVPYQAFPTADGYIVVATGHEPFWEGVCRAVEAEDLLEEERFRTNEGRVVHREELDRVLEARFRTRPRDAWLRRLAEEGVPAAPVQDLAEVFGDPQVVHREMVRTAAHPELGEVKTLAPPFRLTSSSLPIRWPPPLQGEHTRELLAELGYDEARQEELFRTGAVQ